MLSYQQMNSIHGLHHVSRGMYRPLPLLTVAPVRFKHTSTAVSSSVTTNCSQESQSSSEPRNCQDSDWSRVRTVVESVWPGCEKSYLNTYPCLFCAQVCYGPIGPFGGIAEDTYLPNTIKGVRLGTHIAAGNLIWVRCGSSLCQSCHVSRMSVSATDSVSILAWVI